MSIGAEAHAFKDVKSRQTQIAKGAEWLYAPVVALERLKARYLIALWSRAVAWQKLAEHLRAMIHTFHFPKMENGPMKTMNQYRFLNIA